jgi:hypothetical protein
LPRKRPIPCDVATFGSLDVHTAAVPTFTEAAVTTQTTRSPARSVGALQVNASPVPGEGGLGAVGTPLPHADANDTAAVRVTTRLICMAAQMPTEAP